MFVPAIIVGTVAPTMIAVIAIRTGAVATATKDTFIPAILVGPQSPTMIVQTNVPTMIVGTAAPIIIVLTAYFS